MLRRLLDWFRPAPEQLICPVTIGVLGISNGVLMKLFLNDSQEVAVALSNETALKLSNMLESCVVDACRSQGLRASGTGSEVVH